MSRWGSKFRFAGRGIWSAWIDQPSFWIHLPAAFTVLSIAAWLRCEPWQWVALLLAIGLVIVAELLNSAIELLVKAIHPEHHPLVGRALDVAAGGVLFASLIAIVIGLVTLGPKLYERLAPLM